MLFREFDDVASKVTRDYYRAVLGKEIQAQELHSVDERLQRQGRDQEAYKALQRYLQGLYSTYRPLPLLDPDLLRGASNETIAAVRSARAAMLEQLDACKALHTKYHDALKRRFDAEQRQAILRSGISLSRAQYSEGPPDVPGVSAALREAQNQLTALHEPMRQWERLAAERARSRGAPPAALRLPRWRPFAQLFSGGNSGAVLAMILRGSFRQFFSRCRGLPGVPRLHFLKHRGGVSLPTGGRPTQVEALRLVAFGHDP